MNQSGVLVLIFPECSGTSEFTSTPLVEELLANEVI